jgi:hypothetical protein
MPSYTYNYVTVSMKQYSAKLGTNIATQDIFAIATTKPQMECKISKYVCVL